MRKENGRLMVEMERSRASGDFAVREMNEKAKQYVCQIEQMEQELHEERISKDRLLRDMERLRTEYDSVSSTLRTTTNSDEQPTKRRE
jgi:septal ring factor EnvC (AmiA/AmiB activator)